MRIVDYKYIKGTDRQDGLIAIPELDRNTPATEQFIRLAEIDPELDEPTALIFIGGVTVAMSDTGLGKGNGVYFPAIRTSNAYTAHRWIRNWRCKEHVKHIEVIDGTCAAGIKALQLAQELIYDPRNPIKEAVIIGHERISTETLRLFRELNIPITCGDGLVYMRVGMGWDIVHIDWRWAYNENPFAFSREDLDKLIPEYSVGYVKLHGTGTESNEAAEAGLAELGTPIRYKGEIGHTQGISALLETCVLLDDPNIRGRILVTANGLGGYYGAFTLTKPNARDD